MIDHDSPLISAQAPLDFDYLAVVIEWGDDPAEAIAPVAPVAPEVTRKIARPRARPPIAGAVLSALGVLALGVWWGVSRLRHA